MTLLVLDLHGPLKESIRTALLIYWANILALGAIL
jgi:hypothetical protein